MPTDRDSRITEAVELLEGWAGEHERQAREFRDLAAKVRKPPKDTRVEIGPNTIRFVTTVPA